MNALRSATCKTSSRDSFRHSSSTESKYHRVAEVSTKVLSRTEYQRIKELAMVNVKEQQLRFHEAVIKEREEKQREFENLILQNSRLENTGQDDLQITERQQELSEKLKKLRQEEEEEIKKLNQTIIEAKCLAEREKQIQEKQKNVKDLKKMEEEMDRRMAEHQQEMDKKRQQLEREQRQARARYAELVKQQIEDNSKTKKNSQEGLREWEAREISKRINMFESDKSLEKHQYFEKQMKLRDGLAECIEAKNKVQDAEKEAEARRIQRLTRHRLEREEFEARVKEEQQAKEKLRQTRSAYVSRLLHDGTARQQEDSFIRKTREKLDKEWRERELEKARQSAETQERIRLGRQEQLSEKKRSREENEMKEKMLLDQIVRASKQSSEQEKRKQEQRNLDRLRYSSEIRRQIFENEEKNRIDKNAKQREAEELRRRLQEQQKVIGNLKAAKLKELKDLRIPEKYVKEVARKTKIPWDD